MPKGKEVSLMTLTKKKKILLIALPAAVVVIAAGVVLWLVLGQAPQENNPFEIRRSQNGHEIIYCAVKGEEGADAFDSALFVEAQTLPCYTFLPPEGWTMTEDGLEANMINQYCDVFQNQDGVTLRFEQRPALFQVIADSDSAADDAIDPVSIQEVQFGEIQVIYSQENQITRVYWVYAQSLLSIACDQDRDINEMLNFITCVDYDALREKPQQMTQSLSLQRGYYHAEDRSSQSYGSVGNPEVPKQPDMPSLPQPPEGYELVDDFEEPYSDYRIEKYQNQQGELMSFTCMAGANDFFGKWINSFVYFPFTGMSNEELADPDSVQDAVVNGNPAFVHINEDVSEIGWIDGYCTMELRCTAPMTAEQLIALAETVE